MRSLLSKIPLSFRVVFLYILIGLVGLLVYWTILILSMTTAVILPVKNHRTPINGSIVEKIIVDGDPVRLNLDRLNINLETKNGYYDNKSDTWTLSNGITYFAVMTRRPNNQDGSTFIYGHNQDDTLARLSDLIIGDQVDITTSNGYVFSYRYKNDEYVIPSYVKILDYKPANPVLVISMCEGIFSQTRRLMYFDFEEVRKL